MRIGEGIVIDGLAYRLEDVLSSGAGSYGQVWAATSMDGKPVALKFINTEIMAQADPSLRGHWRAHLEREIAFLAGLDVEQSQHIVTLINHGQVDGQPVLVLERLAANLGQWLVQQRKENAPPPDLEQVLDWARQILAALDVIHDAGFVYRDLKFSNILVDETGKRLKLADFGSLKRENGDSTRSFIGTPATMAPEQALPLRFSAGGGEYLVDYRADYYALGLLLFVLLTRQPTTAAQRNLGQLLAQYGQEGAAQAGKQLGGLNDDERDLLRQSIAFWIVPPMCSAAGATPLAQIIERMLARNAAERPQNSAEIRSVIDAFNADYVSSMTLAPLAAAPQAVADWDLSVLPSMPPRQRRSAKHPQHAPRWGRIAAAIGTMSLVGALAWAVVVRPSMEPPEMPAAPAADAVTNSANQATAPATSEVDSEEQPAAAETLTEVAPVAPATSVEVVPQPPTPPLVYEEEPNAPALAEEHDEHTAAEPAVLPAPSVPQSKSKLVAPEPKPTPKPAVAAPQPKPTPKPTVAVPEPKPAPKPAVAAPQPKPAPKPAVAAPEPKPAPKPAVAAPEPKPTPKPAMAAPEPKPASKPAMAAPEPKPASKPAMAAPEPKPAPKPAMAAPEPKPASKPVVVKKLAVPAAKPVDEEKPLVAPSAPSLVKAAPPRVEKPTMPAVAKPMPAQRSVAPVAKVEPPRPPVNQQALPPIRLESRRPVATPAAPAPLPPIQMVSRTQAVTTPSRPPTQINNAAPPRPAVPQQAPATNPVQQFQDDAARASVAVRRDVEALTNWLGRTGNAVSSEVQRGLRDADQAVTRWTTKGGTKVERRDRWSDR